jgi:hypothetical protein
MKGTAMTIARTIAAVAIVALGTSGISDAADSCDRQMVMQIDSAMVSVEPDGVTINAFGVAESAGWKDATLILSGQIANGAATVDFVACRPEVSAQVLTPIQTRTKLPLGADVRQIVVRTKTNAMTVEISRQ